MNPERQIDLIRKEQWHYSELQKESVHAPDATFMNEFSKRDSSVKFVFDQANFKILSASDNLEAVFGYTKSELEKSNIMLFFKVLSLDHALFLYTATKWVTDVFDKIGHGLNVNLIFCGVKAKHKNGRTVRLLIRYSILETFDDGSPKIAAVLFDDVSHFIKGDFYWGRLESDKHIHHFFSRDKKDIVGDIISLREKEILHFVEEGLESKDIGKKLFISHFTVDNHRRNPLIRMGVRDTTGLIQILKMGGII
jgi:DNA-binding CsgD family transcriptional regulator